MKEMLQSYAAYNYWANQRLAEVIRALPPGEAQREVPSSFSSLHATLLHMWNAESGWWQRIRLQERVVMPGEGFSGTTEELLQQYLQQSRLWEEWISQASEAALAHVVAYQNTKREQFKQPVWQVALHVFNHGTYHRGQLVNMLRQLGADKIPGTDFILWARGRK